MSLLVLPCGWILFFHEHNAPQSTDPVELMRIVGQISGAALGVSLVMIVLGLIGKKA